MGTTIGLDLGTNSIGWAIYDSSTQSKITSSGVKVFTKGYGEEKNNEYSRAADRTTHRQARKKYARRKMRKVRLLRLLIAEKMCPLTEVELNLWSKYRKGTKQEYPKSKEFSLWLALNPYELRAKAVDSNSQLSRYEIGRVLYHLIQRRGYQSNRKDGSKEKDGAVAESIGLLNQQKGEQTLGQYFAALNLKNEKIRSRYTSRFQYRQEFDLIGQQQQIPEELTNQLRREIFFQRPLKSQKHTVGKCTLEKNKPRCPISHPEFELFRMWQFVNSIKVRRAGTNDEFLALTTEQKNVLIPKFTRKSKPDFEFAELEKELNKDSKKTGIQWETNYLQTAHNKSLKVIGCPTIAQLIAFFGDNWQELAIPHTNKNGKTGLITAADIWHIWFSYEHNDKLFEFAKQKLGFDDQQATDFSKVSLKTGYASLSLKAIRNILPFLKNGMLYSHAVFCAKLPTLLGLETWEKIGKNLTQGIGLVISDYAISKSKINIVNRLVDNFRKNYGNAHPDYTLDEKDQTEVLVAITHELGKRHWQQLSNTQQETWITDISFSYQEQLRKKYAIGSFLKPIPLDEKIKEFIRDNTDLNDSDLANLYHPSAIDVYPQAKRQKDGKRYLQSPRINSVRNPMAMRTLHELRYLINELIKKEQINEETTVVIELARELNDANMRKAIQRYQRERENDHKNYIKEIKLLYKEQCGSDIDPTDNDLLKFRLWKEQENMCMYTGSQIRITDFLGNNPTFDLCHTWPRSITFDNSIQNLTLGHAAFNRQVQGTRIPTELANYEEERHLAGIVCSAIAPRLIIWERNLFQWNEKYENARYRAKMAADKESKDNAIQYKHYCKMHRDYWSDKLYRFTATEIRSGFKNSQLRDTSLITKYAKLYLETVFEQTRVVKGSITAEFRKLWGLQQRYDQKSREQHTHHAIDAIVLACITRQQYDVLANYYLELEQYDYQQQAHKPSFPQPWPNFLNDVQQQVDQILVKHHYKNELQKPTRKKWRVQGRIQYQRRWLLNESGEKILDQNGRPTWEWVVDENGNRVPRYQEGQTARSALHKDTFYGAIQQPERDKEGNIIKTEDGTENRKIVYVQRKAIESLKPAEVDKIVDPVIKQMFNDKGLEHVIKNGLFLPNRNGSPVPVKKVRIRAEDVSSPIELKQHSHPSNKPWKLHSLVKNDTNYVIGIYIEENAKKRPERSFYLVNTYEAVKIMGDTRNVLPYSITKMTAKGEVDIPLYRSLQMGQSVLLYEDNADEINWNDRTELSKRLFTIKGLSVLNTKSGKYGRINLIRNDEARKVGELQLQTGAFELNDKKTYRMLLDTQLNFLSEGEDFIVLQNGEVERK